jgi:hypothetical protein
VASVEQLAEKVAMLIHRVETLKRVIITGPQAPIVVGNQPPTVTLALSASSALAPAAVTLTATPIDTDGTIQRVEFFQNGAPLIPPKTAAPYTHAVTGLATGTYVFDARAYDNEGAAGNAVPQSFVALSSSNSANVALSSNGAVGSASSY